MTTERHPLLSALKGYAEYERLHGALLKGEGAFSVFGLGEAHKAHMAAALYRGLNRSMLFVTANESSAAKLCAEMNAYTDSVYHFPARELPLSAKGFTASSGLSARRVGVLYSLCEGKRMAVVTSAEALLQRLAPPEAMAEASETLKAGQRLEPRELIKRLVEFGYERVELCEGKGQAAMRGGYVDVFPLTLENPVRIEFFDDEIDTMREYDPLTQRSLKNVESVLLPPAGEVPLDAAARARALKALSSREGFGEECEALRSGGTPRGAEALLPFFYKGETTLLDYFPNGACILLDEPPRVEENAKAVYDEFIENAGLLLMAKAIEPEQAELLSLPQTVLKRLDTPRTAMLFAFTRTFAPIAPKGLFRFETRPATKYLGGEEILRDDINAWRRNSETVVIYAGAHYKRLQDRLMDLGVFSPGTESLKRELVPGEFLIVGESLEKGFSYPELKLNVISEAELYGETPKRAAAAKRKRPQLAFSELGVGDLVVHETHGIGRFVGVQTLRVGDVERDYLHLAYAGGDKLYIPTDQLDRVQKYIGGDEGAQKLSRLGSGEWQKTVSRTRESVKKLAFDLVKLYGERSKRKGFRFSPDSPWQKRLEENFPYEETPDQLTAIAEIKRDMESERVMDRLLCGDVGYGKTEVALRAAFKAVMDSKQTALLVPTTILAQQHFNTLAARFAGFPVQVALLSRFLNPSEEKATLRKIENGSVDVVVGTHKLLSGSVKFKDLGLLVVDEEQRFGVGHKEQIKNLKASVDVLTLSATPIPRTLHMSMTGIRDMSVIETPPEQRYPVQTYVMEYNDAVVREAILKELTRGGQTYFVYNRVRNMEQFAEYLRSLVPQARIAYAHGQMSERTLEKTMVDFLDQQYDVLLCSTIIESGLDIQNVNTIIVYDADHMGLSQLYQLRGRVGRGARLGYAYLTFRRNKVLSEVAEKRLSAIREFTQFGSGFKIAMKDLEIRGAGNLLGPEQHGHMAAVGYDLYCKLIGDAVREAKGEPEKREVETAVEIPIPASLPHSYIAREADRLNMYKRIALVETDDDVLDVQDELIDRYGEIPQMAQNLLFIAKLKSDASKAYVTKLSVKEGEARLTLDAQAPMDLNKLMGLIQKTQGAQLINGEEPIVAIRRRNAEAAILCRDLPQFVYSLRDCIGG
ncbi:MAG: transcription-repair coupling factor [Clostridiaceae bacterium]|nr:transcription-repair coupling factor [Eubacteriales bacterium]